MNGDSVYHIRGQCLANWHPSFAVDYYIISRKAPGSSKISVNHRCRATAIVPLGKAEIQLRCPSSPRANVKKSKAKSKVDSSPALWLIGSPLSHIFQILALSPRTQLILQQISEPCRVYNVMALSVRVMSCEAIK